MKKHFVLLAFMLIVLVGLFSFSTWTTGHVVSGGSAGLGLASTISPLLIGLFLVIGLAVVVLVSVDVS